MFASGVLFKERKVILNLQKAINYGGFKVKWKGNWWRKY